MNMIVTAKKHSYAVEADSISIKNFPMIELGSTVFIPAEGVRYMVLAPGELTRVDIGITPGELTKVDIETSDVNTADELLAIMNEVSGEVNIALKDDIALESYVSIAGEGVVDMDLNGHTIIRDQATALYVNSDNVEVNIRGNGEIAGAQAVWANAGTANIYEGIFRANQEGGSDCIYASGTGKINIYGGEFFAEINEDDFAESQASCLNIKDGSRITASINVYGGTFHNFNPADNVSEGPGTNFVAPGYKVIEESEGIFIVVPE